MNVDFLAVGGTAWTVAGTMIVACTEYPYLIRRPADKTYRRSYADRSRAIPGGTKCNLCECSSESYKKGGMQCI